MKKVLIMITALVLACGLVSASRPASKAEAMEMVRSGEARKAPPVFRNASEDLFFSNGTTLSIPHAIPRKVSAPVKSSAKPPMKLTAGGSTIYGWLGSSYASGFFPGMFELTADGYTQLWEDPKFIDMDYNTMQTGWLANGKVCGYVFDLYYGYVYGIYYEEIDFATGKTLSFDKLDLSTAQQYTACTLRPSDGSIYGYGLCPTSYDYAFFKSSPSAPGEYELLSTITNDQLPYAICHNPVDDTLYGVTIRQKVVKINYDGTQEELFALPYDNLAYYIAGIVFSPLEDAFIMNVNFDNYTSSMIKIKLDGTVEPYMDLNNGESFNMLFTTDNDVRPQSPARPELTELNFEDGATSGYALFQIPSLSVNGDPITSSMSGTVLLDGTLYKELSGIVPGESFKVEFSDIPSGRHHFEFYLTSEAGFRSGSVTAVRWVGNDVPMAPTNVKFADGQLSWDPVTQGVNGGYLNLDNMEYIVSVLGERYCVTKDTHATVEVPADIEQQKVAVSVVASCSGVESEPSLSNKVLMGAPWSLPMHVVPNQEQADLCQVIDGNANGTGWQFNPFDGDFRCTYTSPGEGDMDDWVFLPYFSIDDTNVCYHLSFEAGLFTDTYQEESLEVFVGKAPGIGKAPLAELMTVPVIEEFYIPDFGSTYEGLFSVEEPGVYYIGFHCTSKEDQFGYWVKNITISNPGVQTTSPGRVTDLSATGAEAGVLKATVNFTMPLVDISGKALDAGTALTAVVTATEANQSVEVSGQPGEKVSVEIPTIQNTNTITVKVRCGELQGLEATTSVYTGVEIPAPVENIKGVVSDNMVSLTISWDGPTEGENGGYIVPENVVYHIYKAVPTASGSRDLVKIATTTETSYTYTNTESQEFLEIGVLSGNEAGECNTLMGVSELVGAPYTLPMVEAFEDPSGNMAQNPWLIYSPADDYSAYWSVGSPHDVDPSFDDRMSLALLGKVRYDAGKGCIGLPRFSTENQSEVTLTITTYHGPSAGNMSINGECKGMDGKITVGDITCNTEEDPHFATKTFTIPSELIGKPWVQLYIECDLPDPMHTSAFNYLEIEGKTNGISPVTDTVSPRVYGGTGVITVAGCKDASVSVVTVSGATVASVSSPGDDLTIPVAPGLYLVSVGCEVTKVIVK